MYRIGVGGFIHETHTFCPAPTGIKDFEDQKGVHTGKDLVKYFTGTNDYYAGYFDVLAAHGAEVIPTSHAYAGVNNYVTKEAFDKYTSAIVDGLNAGGKLDGVLLALHGAMVSEEHIKPEAEIVGRVRKAVGNVPIFVTLDFHANEDHELTDVADAVFVQKKYPHTDMRECGRKAAECLMMTLAGKFVPTMAIVKPGIISPSVFQWSDGHPVRMFREVADAWEKQEGVYYVSIACGFGYADAPDTGASVIAVTNNDKNLAEKVARHVASIMWEFKEDLAQKPILKTREAVAKAMDLVAKGIRPVVLADGSDRTGDNTLVLGELLRRGAKNVGHSALADKGAVKECQRAGLGATVTVKAGGWAPASGDPLTLTGKITFLGTGDYTKTGPMQQGTTGVCGPTAVLDIGDGNYVIITTFNHQATDDAQFRAYNIDLDRLDIITLRSRVHFRAFYEKVAGAIIEVDAPGLGPADLSVFDYRHLSKDVYPVGANWRKGTK